MNAVTIIALLNAYRFRMNNETDLQDGIEQILTKAGAEVQREVRLNAKDRIDLMVGTIGIEVKVGHSFASVLRQVQRYNLLDEVSELILVTTRGYHEMPATLAGKPVHVVTLLTGIL